MFSTLGCLVLGWRAQLYQFSPKQALQKMREPGYPRIRPTDPQCSQALPYRIDT